MMGVLATAMVIILQSISVLKKIVRIEFTQCFMSIPSE